jgi:hypothetical protein
MALGITVVEVGMRKYDRYGLGLFAFFVLMFGCLNLSAADAVGTGDTIDCRFSPAHLLVLENNQIREEKDTSKEMLLTFTSFEPAGTALLVGNAGSVKVFLRNATTSCC